jgi:ABC-type multidrug transport system fused ATPase/permease subunit
MTIVMSIGSIAAPATAASRAAGAAAIFFHIIDAPKPRTEGLGAPDVSSYNDIIFEKVNFAYPTRPDVQVLRDLTVQFPAGKLTAIVGESGSGKSTIVTMLERWYELNDDIANVSVSVPPDWKLYLIRGTAALFSIRFYHHRWSTST